MPPHTLAARSESAPPWVTASLVVNVLAGLTIILQTVDLVTALRMMATYGTSLEQNPIARAIVTSAGPVGFVATKLGVVVAGVLLLLILARLGRARLARNCLALTALLGLVGALSNAVG